MSLLTNAFPTSFDDLLFEGRNQAYGAYQLRQDYNSHVRKALGLMMGLCAVLTIGGATWHRLHPADLPGGGGQQAIVNAIQKAFRYPAVDLRNQVEGRVFAKFTVDENGGLTDVEVVKGLSGTIDAETIRAIKTLPKFIPGKQN
nr:hypothetical protein [Tanacetum cinerariifolium]